MNIGEIAETMRISGRHLSIDAPFVHGEESRLLDILPNESQPPPDSELIHESLCYEIHQALSTLPEREAAVVRYYFGVDGCPQLTLEEIGEKLGLTRERVRQIKEKAIRRLRHNTRSKELRAYLG
jgi:RNA polymerase primary sigma factor